MGKKVSIIIPVYNCEKYLATCLESLLHQTYRNFEIILIDDGSTDGSGAICEKFAENSVNIKVIHQKNSGPGTARNAGLDVATGEYLTFVDADDYVSKNYVETLTDLLEKYQADIAEVGLVCLYKIRNVFEASDETVQCFQGRECLIKDYFSENRKLRNCIAGRMYNLQKCRDIRFSEKSIGEDTEYSLRMLSRCDRLVKYHKCLYACRAYQETLTRREFNRKNFDVVEVAYQDLLFAEHMGVELDSWEYVFLHFTELCYKLLADLAVQKKEYEFNTELQEMLQTYKKMDEIARCHQMKLENKIITDVSNIVMWAQEYRKNNRFRIFVKYIRNMFSGVIGCCKVRISYEYKFKE